MASRIEVYMSTLIALSFLMGALSLFTTPWCISCTSSLSHVALSIKNNLFFNIFISSVAVFVPVLYSIAYFTHKNKISVLFLYAYPLAFLSFTFVLVINFDIFSIPVVTNFRFFYSLFLIACTLTFLFPQKYSFGQRMRKYLITLILPVSAFFIWTTYYAANTVGTSAGDEVVYIVMTDSIYTDRSLDMKAAWARLRHDGDLEEVRPRGFMHLASNARDDKWYSWHPFGLPLLLSPLWIIADSPPGNILARSIGMGLITALGCLGLWFLCKRAGASDMATILSLTLICGSVYWTSFASRVLTEMPGAVLLIWLFWAIAAVRDRPYISLAVAAFTTVYCAFMHLRFLPLGLIGAFFFVASIYYYEHDQKTKKTLIFIFIALTALGYAFWGYIQYSMFTGPSQPVSSTLMSYPNGIWQIFLDRYAAGAGLVTLYSILAAHFFWILKSRELRILQVSLATVFLACIFLNTTNVYSFVSTWDCTPGRYLFVVVPLLAPGLAYALTKASRPSTTFFIFLGLVTIATTIVYFYFLPVAPKRTLAHHLLFLSQQPPMLGFFMPFAKFYEFSDTVSRLGTVFFALTTTVFSYALLCYSSQTWTFKPIVFVSAIIVSAVIAHAAQPENIAVRKILPEPVNISIPIHSMHNLTGDKVICEDSNRRVILAKESFHEPGFLAFGRYTTLGGGKYAVEFDVESVSDADGSPAIVLEVVSDEGQTVIVSREIDRRESMKTERLVFDVEESVTVEPRVYYLGLGEAKLFSIRLVEIE